MSPGHTDLRLKRSWGDGAGGNGIRKDSLIFKSTELAQHTHTHTHRFGTHTHTQTRPLIGEA